MYFSCLIVLIVRRPFFDCTSYSSSQTEISSLRDQPSLEQVKSKHIQRYIGNLLPYIIDLCCDLRQEYWIKMVDHGMVVVEECNFLIEKL